MITIVFCGTAPSLATAADYSILNDMRAIHMGGNWGLTNEQRQFADDEKAQGYIDWLKSMNVNWVGISVALQVDDSMDSQVKTRFCCYEPGGLVPTFTDEELTQMISRLRDNGMHVYMTLSFEIHTPDDPEKYLDRGMLSRPDGLGFGTTVTAENWPWAVDHPNHDAFVAEFFQTYTEHAVHYAELAESLGVELYSLGTESDALMRTRPNLIFRDDFLDELRTLVSAVRAVYSGLLTYDMFYATVSVDRDDLWQESTRWMWQDLGLDVIGLSGYFELVQEEPTERVPYSELKSAYESVFTDFLLPLQTDNPGIPIVFTEFGYVDSTRAPRFSALDEFTEREFSDQDNTGEDDGAETQSDMYRSLFETNREHNDLVKGTFLWGHGWADDALWNTSFQVVVRDFAVRGKLAEELVRAEYASRKQSMETFVITAGLNDAWVSRFAPFQGMFITVFPDLKLMFVAWFTFDSEIPAGPFTANFGADDQRWVTGLGTYDGNRAELNIELTTGGRFNSSDPLAAQDASYGTMTVEFTNCKLASIAHDFPAAGMSGLTSMTRVLESNVPLCESLITQ